ncbi:MAG: hypothetical protein QM775_15805 [Pirellulales bacterium]
MANPFSIFRKYQKVMMATVTLLAILAFVFFDNVSPQGYRGNSADPVVVESDYFKLKESDLGRAIRQRLLVHQVLTRAASTMRMAQELQRIQQQFQGIDPSFLEEQKGMIEARIAQQTHADVVNFIGSADERSVVRTMALAETAKRMGVQVSNERVEGFIFGLVPGLSKQQFVQILQGISQLSLNDLYDAFRRELLAESLRYVLASNSASASTPVDRWNYFQRKNLRASVEVLPVRTADIIKAGKVAEPTDGELKAYYALYEFLEPVPGSPTPGFKIPQKAAFQYFSADEAKFYAPEKITAEEIAAHYEANKSRYPYTVEDFAEPAAPKPNEAKTEAKPVEMPAADKPAAEKPEDKKAAESKPAESKPTVVSPDCGEATDDGLSDEFSASDCADEPAKPADGKDEKKAEEKKPEDKKADDKKSEEKKPEVKETPKPAASPSPTATAAAPAATPVATPTATGTAAPTATGTIAPAVTAPVLPPLPLPSEDILLPEDVRTGKNPQYDPLWRVEDKIRQELADAAARKAIQDAFSKLREKMNDLTVALVTSDQSDKFSVSNETFSALAKDYPGIEAKSTDLLDRNQAIAIADEPGLFHSTVNGAPFVQMEYSGNMTYSPRDAQEIPVAPGPGAPRPPTSRRPKRCTICIGRRRTKRRVFRSLRRSRTK